MKSSNVELIEKLNYFMNDKDAHSFLLNGPWGVGKTYAVNHWLSNASPILNGYKVIHLSLFGISSIEELNSLALNSESIRNSFFDYLKKINQNATVGVGPITVSIPLIGIIANLLKRSHKNKEKFLFILDDIERKDNKLRIPEIFGFVDSLPKENTKVILIANTEKIESELKGFKEKIIQYEYTLVKPSKETIASVFGTKYEVPDSLEISNLRTLIYAKRIVEKTGDNLNKILIKAILLSCLAIREGKYLKEDYIKNYEQELETALLFETGTIRDKAKADIELKIEKAKNENKLDERYFYDNVKRLNLLNEIKESKLLRFVVDVYIGVQEEDYSKLRNIEISVRKSPLLKTDERGAYVFLSDKPSDEYFRIMTDFKNLFLSDKYDLIDAFRNMCHAVVSNDSLIKPNSKGKRAEKEVFKICTKPLAKYIFNNVNSKDEGSRIIDSFIYPSEWLIEVEKKVFSEFAAEFNAYFKEKNPFDIKELKEKIRVMNNVFDNHSIDKKLFEIDEIITRAIRNIAQKPSKRITEDEWREQHEIAQFIYIDRKDYSFQKTHLLIERLEKRKDVVGFRFSVLKKQYSRAKSED